MNQPKRILIVDDDPVNRKLLLSMMEPLGHETEVAQNGREALSLLQPNIDLILLDVMMPDLNGFEVVQRIRQNAVYSDLPIIMVTSLDNREHRLQAVKVGANDYIAKPVDMMELRVRTTSMLKMKEAQDAVKRYQTDLEERVEKRTAALRKALADVTQAQRLTSEAHLDTIRRLVIAAEYKDQNAPDHIERVSLYSTLLAQSLDLPAKEVELVRVASPMHDVGKIGIDDAILLKPGKLNPDELEIVKQHTLIGAHILDGSPSELLQAGKVIALSHHEKWDGSGYPFGLAGDDIPLWGRICAVADVFDTLTSDRPYSKAASNEDALEILQEERGKHFDPHIVDLFIKSFDMVLDLQTSLVEDVLPKPN